MSRSEQRALEWLAQNSGRGSINPYGRIENDLGQKSGFDTATWLRLVARGYVASGVKPLTIGLTMEGIDALARIRSGGIR